MDGIHCSLEDSSVHVELRRSEIGGRYRICRGYNNNNRLAMDTRQNEATE